MGKKSDTVKTAAAATASPASAAKTAAAAPAPLLKPEAARPPAMNGDGAPAKAAVKKKPVAKKPAKKAVTKKPAAFSTEEVALRAYFIAEHRQRMGLHGDAHTDWIEAERQLKKEQTAQAAKNKKPAAKKRA